MKVNSFFKKPYFPYLLLILIVMGVYYKLFLFGKIPFPGDLLITSYSPWLDYYKFPVQNPVISDVFSQFFLWKYLAIDILKSWQWPLWNPYSFTGTPLLATYHSATLYPLNILLLLPKYFGWGIFIFSQTLIGATAMYLLLSIWLPSKLARLTGAVIFAFGGLMTTWLELGTAVHAISWLPLCLYSVNKYLQTLRLRYTLLLTLTFSSLILAGNAQIATYSFVIVTLFSIIRAHTKILPILISLLLAITLTSLQLLPSLDMLKKSIRVSDFYTGEFNYGLLDVKDSLKLFVPDFFGNPVTRNYWGSLNYSETSSFVGSLTLPLLIFSLFYLRRTRITIFFHLILAFSLLLSFSNPLSQMIYQMKIPLLTSSYASRMLFITSFSIAILSAFSLNQILTAQNQTRKFFKSIIWSWSILVGILIGSLFVHQIIKIIIDSAPSKDYLNFYLRDNDYALSNFIVSSRNSILPISLASFLLTLFVIITKAKVKFFKFSKIYLICSILFIVLTFDLSRYFLKFNPFVPQELIFPEVPALHFLQKQPGIFRVGREHAEVLPPNTWTAYNVQSYEGYDPIYLNQYGKFMHFLNGGDIRSGSTGRYAELWSNYKSPYLDAANVKYFIGIGRDRNGHIPGDLINYKFNETGYKRVFQDKSAVILENPNALERVYFAKSIIIGSTKQIEAMVMEDKKFDPRITTVLTQDLNIKEVSGTGSAVITKYSPNKIIIKTNTKHDEVLILADQYEEGWKAQIDGQETIISPANLIFRAVKVPAGNHEVIFKYWPKSFDIGLKISLVTSLLISLIVLITIKLRKF